MTFLNSLFLLGLSAAVLPILIHLLARQKARRMPFGSIDFIRRLEERRRRRFRLTQLLLLALRVLLLLMVALGFARPTLSRSFLGIGGSGGATAAVIILDTSASMGSDDGGRSLFEAARERAASAAALLADNDESALVLASNVTAGPPPGLVRSRDLLRQEIARAELTAGSSDLGGALRTATRLLSEARAANREIYVVSDFQKTAFANVAFRAALPKGTKVYLLPVASTQRGNMAVTRVAWREERVGSGEVTVDAQVERFGGSGPADAIVTLDVDGAAAGRRLVTLEPGERRSVPFTVALSARGEHRGAVGIDAPDLVADNERPFVLGLPDGARVLVLDGRAPGDRASAYHVARALAPGGEGSGFFRVTESRAGEGALPDLAAFGAVVLAEAGRLSPSDLTRLADYAKGGGGVLLFPGRNLDAAFANKELFPRLGVPLAFTTPPAEFPGSFARIDEVADGHPLFAPFGESPERYLRDTRFFRYFPATPSQGARVIARFGGGAPAFVEADLAGGGRALVASFPADPDWTTLPRDAAFLPLLHEAVKRLTRLASPEESNVLVGTTYRRLLRELPAGGEIVAVGPDGKETLLSPKPEAAGLVVETRETSRPGFTTLRTPAGDYLIAAQVDPAESDLSTAARSEVLESIPGAEMVDPAAEVRRAVLAGRFGREYWREVLLLALALAVVEAFVARGVSRPSTAEAGARRAA